MDLWVHCVLVVAALAALFPLPGEGAVVDGNSFSFGDGDGDASNDEVQLISITDQDRFEYNVDNEDGTYQYGYQSGRLDEDNSYNFKHEYRRQDGVLIGQHGYRLPDGSNYTVNYVSDARGYRVLADGQQYEPVSEQQLEKQESRQRDLLGEILAEEEEQEPLMLDLALLRDVPDPEEVSLPASDAEAALSAPPLPAYSQLDPDTGAFKFGYRRVAADGSVLYRQEERRPDGVVLGQFGHRGAEGGEGSLTSFVSDAFGYRLVDPAAPVPVVSRQRARQLELQEIEGSGEASPEPSPEEAAPEVQVESAPQLAELMAEPAPEMQEPSPEESAPEMLEPSPEMLEPSPEPAPSSSEDGAAVDSAPVDGAAVEAASVIDGAVESVVEAADDSVVVEAARPSLLQVLRPPYGPVTRYSSYIPYYSPHLNYGAYQTYGAHQTYGAYPQQYTAPNYPDSPAQYSGVKYQPYPWSPYGALYSYSSLVPVRAGQYPASTYPLYSPLQEETAQF